LSSTRSRVNSCDARRAGLNGLLLGARDSITEQLQQAVEAYRLALQELTPDRMPLE
jgi:hypothetical protein